MSEVLGYLTFGFLIFFVLLAVGAYALYWFTHKRGRKSPFSKKALARGELILFPTAQKITTFLIESTDPENNPIDFKKACFCRETGRIFPEALNTFGEISLQKDYYRHYTKRTLTPWNRLSDGLKERIFVHHPSLKERSKEELYVDLKDDAVAEWTKIPQTEMEVFIIRPAKR